mmetsp:Transcript_10868/g.25739  ORF Transcript_10868/g.25739 Transcript_10868/m.25739 type:complete len:85 (+) Transcript_10868:1265-1519(+)
MQHYRKESISVKQERKELWFFKSSFFPISLEKSILRCYFRIYIVAQVVNNLFVTVDLKNCLMNVVRSSEVDQTLTCSTQSLHRT